MPGQQVIDVFGGMVVDTGEDVGEPGPRVNVVEFAGLDQRIDRCSATPAAVGAGEGPVFATDRDATDGAFSGVV